MLSSELQASGLSTPSAKAALTSKTYDVDDFAAVQELYHANGWTDGLPIVPPTKAAVEACLDWALMPPDQLVAIEPVREQPITAEKLAINAVMAGCLPLHFPVVATAWQAMMKPEFLLHGVTSSTGGCAVLVIINGPVRTEIGANGTFNALANSDRATAVIGRALRLALINLLDVRAGGIDRSTLGHPGKFSYCLAEDEEGTGWQPLSLVRGIPDGTSAVTVMAAMAPRQIMNEWTTDPREILETFAAEMRANQLNYSIYGGNYVIVVPKQLREPIERAGWSKRDIAEFLFERARVRRADWAGVGKQSIVRDRASRIHPALSSPDDLLVVAAGGPAGGFGAVIAPWMGSKTRAVTAAIGACVDCEPPKAGACSGEAASGSPTRTSAKINEEPRP
ncbi:MAG TPA: hypothetical protein VII40_10280 [Xanthobacteraceae bacterium]|jgi:hypothetical protein